MYIFDDPRSQNIFDAKFPQTPFPKKKQVKFNPHKNFFFFFSTRKLIHSAQQALEKSKDERDFHYGYPNEPDCEI